MIERRFSDVWQQLQGRKPYMPHFLNEVYLDGIRGITGLRVIFDYPVSVVAGGNATGKSTVLFAAACAYKPPDAGPRDYVPSTLFPDFRPRQSKRHDQRDEVLLRFDYSSPEGRQPMQWKRGKGWNRSFLGRKHARQPERPLYLRTLSNLSNPSEVRGVLSMSRVKAVLEETPLTASQVGFAQRVLPFRYSEVIDLAGGKKKLLFATRERGAEYSELHMAAGERAILRLSQEIAQLRGALVLIDAIEAGLHPWVQQLLMLHLQQLALRRDLQVIVMTHSPVVLDSVPPNARIFLDRDEDGRVVVRPPYRDLVQDALYGRANDTLNVLCENEAAEAILQGVFDHLLPHTQTRSGSVRIGRDTGAEEFPTHAAAFRKFGQIGTFVFVLDGDAEGQGIRRRIRDNAGTDVPVLYLLGRESPEAWLWSTLPTRLEEISNALGADAVELRQAIAQADAVYASASDSPSEIAKGKLYEFSQRFNREPADIGRLVGRLEAACDASDIQPFVEQLQTALHAWRSL